MALYGSYGSGNGLPFYMKPVNRWWDGYRGQPVASLWPACGQPVASPDDPSVQRFRELEQEVKVWADRYPFIAELKDHSIRAKPEWLVVASNYPLEELTNASRNPTFYQCALQTHRRRPTALPLHDPLLQTGHRTRRRGDQTTLPSSPREVRRDCCQQPLICLFNKFHKRDSQGGGRDALPGNVHR